MRYKKELIAWTKGERLQFKDAFGTWQDHPGIDYVSLPPCLRDTQEWRIKPKEQYIAHSRLTGAYIEDISENELEDLKKNPNYILYKATPL